jgi:hypothetical protein
MVNEPFDEDDGWPDPKMLAAWRVPSLPDDFADRVLANAAFADTHARPHRDRDRPLAPLVAAIAGALAVAAALVLVLATRPERPVATPPEPVAVPVSVIASVPPVPETPAPPLPVPQVVAGPIVVIDVTVEPATAEVRVVSAGHELVRGRGSQPFAVNRERNDDIVLEVSAPDFEPKRVPVHFSDAGQISIEITLEPLPPSLRKTPRSRTPSGSAPADSSLKDPFRKGGDDDSVHSPNLKDPFHKAPAPAASRTSTLRIGVRSGYGPAKVSIDGDVVGTTPIVNHRVTPGVHRIRWDWDDGLSFETTVDVPKGEVRLVKNG